MPLRVSGHAPPTTHHAPRITHPLIFRAHAPINWPTSGVQTCSAEWNLSHGLRKCLPDSARVRPDHAAGRVVGATVAHVPRALGLHYLRDLGGVSRRVLSLGTLPLAVLFTGAFRRRDPQLVRGATELVAGLASVFARAVDPLGAGRFSADLLLLPRGLLQS